MPVPHHQDDVFADVAVVAYVNEVIDLCPAADAGLLESASVDGGVRADLHVVFNQQRPLLRELCVGAGLGVAHVAEAVGPEHRACVNDDAIAQRRSGIEHRPRIDAAVLADANPLADHRTGFDARAGADFGVGTDDRAGADRDSLAQFYVAAHVVRLIDQRLVGRGLHQLGRLRKPEPWLIRFGNGHCGVGGVGFERACFEHQSASATGEGFRGGSCVFSEDKVPRAGRGGLSTPVSSVAGPLRQPAAQLFNQFAQRHASLPKAGIQ